MSNLATDDLYTNPQVIFELAAGVESLESIATRYELDELFLRELMENPRVKKVISEKRKELDDTGYTLAQKAKLCFESLLSDVYMKARKPDAPLGATLAAAEFFRKVAGLDKQDAQAQSAQFSISINLGGAGAAKQMTVDVTSKPVDTAFKLPSFMTSIPEFIMPGDADINDELSYNGE